MTRAVLALCAALAGCQAEPTSKQSVDQTSSAPNHLTVASDSEVIVIPIELEGDKLPSRFRRVQGSATRDNQSLIEAAFTCPLPLPWVDRTSSHWGAIIFPSEKSKIWGSNGSPRLTNDEMIDCIRSRTAETFYVAISPKGHRTNDLTIVSSLPAGSPQ